MASAARIGGIAYLKVDGTQYQVRGNFKVRPLSLKNEGIAGSDTVHGFKQTPMVPSIECEVSDLGGLSIKALQSQTDVTVTAELNNGKTYIGRNGWFAGEGELDTGEGKTTVKWEFMSVEEDLAA